MRAAPEGEAAPGDNRVFRVIRVISVVNDLNDLNDPNDLNNLNALKIPLNPLKLPFFLPKPCPAASFFQFPQKRFGPFSGTPYICPCSIGKTSRKLEKFFQGLIR